MYEIFEKLLMERGVTAYKVAKATGISTGSMTDWKKGRSAPKLISLHLLRFSWYEYTLPRFLKYVNWFCNEILSSTRNCRGA